MTLKVCSTDGCDNLHHARGLCHLHYSRWYNNANPASRATPRPPRPAIARIPLGDVYPDKRAVAWAGQVRFEAALRRRKDEPAG